MRDEQTPPTTLSGAYSFVATSETALQPTRSRFLQATVPSNLARSDALLKRGRPRGGIA